MNDVIFNANDLFEYQGCSDLVFGINYSIVVGLKGASFIYLNKNDIRIKCS